MIIFKLEHDKTLICTHCDLVHQFEHNADKLVFLIPDSIDGLDLTDCSAVLRYTLPDADHTDGTLPLTSEESAANSYLRFSTPIISALTTDVGDLQISLSIVDQSGTTALRSSYATVQITPAMGTYDMISPDDIGHLGFTTIGNLRENVEKILNDMSIGNMMPISPMSATTLGGAMADQAEDGDTQPVRIGTDQKLYTAQGVCLDSTLSKEDHAADAAEVGKRIRSLSEDKMDNQAMSSATLGGAMADPAEEGDTQPVRIGEDNKLYTAPGGGAHELPLIQEFTITDGETSEIAFTGLAGLTRFYVEIDSPAISGTATYSGLKVYINGKSTNDNVVELRSYGIYTTLNRKVLIYGFPIFEGNKNLLCIGQAVVKESEFNKTDVYTGINFSGHELAGSIKSIYIIVSKSDIFFNPNTVVTLRGE